MSELQVATNINDEDYTIIVQGGINKRVSRGIFKQKEYNNLDNRPYINSNFSSSLVPTLELLQGTIQFHRISKTGKYGDLLDLPYIPVKLSDLTNDGYYVQDQYYVHTDNNLTSGLIDRLNSAIQSIKVNNNLITPNASQEIDITIPTKLSDLTNDGYFVQDENYVHTDNNFNTNMKNSYDNLVVNVNQPVSATNKIATMNDIEAIDSGYWVILSIYKDILFDGVINSTESVPTTGTYAVLEVKNDILVVNKYTDGVSDNADIPFKEGYFVFVKGTDTEIVYYIKENVWSKLGTDLGNYYNKQESEAKFVAKEEGKSLITNEEKTKLNGISVGANKVEASTTNGNILINGQETTVYALSKGAVIDALGYTPVEATVDLSGYYDKQQVDSKFVQKETGKSLISDDKISKIDGISVGANKVEASTTNGNIKIDGVETTVYTKPALTKSEVTNALGYTPPTSSVVTTSANGLMSKDMLIKLNGISTGATKVQSSNTNGNILIDGTEVTVYKKSDLTKAEVITALGYTPPTQDTNTTYDVVTASSNGLMSTDMLAKLNGITASADSVSFSRSLSSGTKIGAITINGTATDLYAPTNTDTHYTTHLYVGTSSGNANASTSNGNTYLMVLDDTTVRDRRLIKGTGGTSVSSDASGNITIYSSTDPKTIYANFLTYWYYYDDGTDLTATEGLTMEDYDAMKPGVILEYTPSNSYNTTYYALILAQKSYYSYKSAGGRYYIREYTIVDSSGYIDTYTFSADPLFGGTSVYKGSNLDEVNDDSGAVACFTSDTLINTENGLVPIKDLKIKNKVYSKNGNNEIELKEIIKTFSHKTDKIYKIDTGSNVIKSSWSHPFFVYDKGKVLAQDLKIGDKLQDTENNIITIKNIEIVSEPTLVFEIRVKDNENYFVGTDKIFVGCEKI